VDSVGVGELVEFVLDQIENDRSLVGGPREVLRREGIQRQFLDSDVLTPLQESFGRLGTGPVAVRRVLAVFASVASIAVLDDGDVTGRPIDLPFEKSFVHTLGVSAKPRSHYPRGVADVA